MRALTFDAHGGPEVLRVDEVETPVPGEGEVLVRVEAASLNHHDLFTRRGMPGISTPLPMVLGCDGAGRVAAIGPGVEGWAEGDRVLIDPLRGTGMLGDTFWGTCAEYVLTTADQLLALPDDVDAVTASTLVVAYGTAHRMLFARGRLTAGESILILGASGGVGTCCVLLAKQTGARVVAVTGSSAKVDRLRALGADDVVDTTVDDLVEHTRRTTGGGLFRGGGYDVVMNSTGGDTWAPSLRCVRLGGRVLVCGATAGYEAATDLRYVWTAQMDLLGSDGWTRDDIAALVEMVGDGRLAPVIDRILPLDDAVEGVRLLEEREVVGKVVIVP